MQRKTAKSNHLSSHEVAAAQTSFGLNHGHVCGKVKLHQSKSEDEEAILVTNY
jgi:hypothetical protein